MANAVNAGLKQAALTALLQGKSVYVALLNTTGAGTTYTYSSTHRNLSDVPPGSIITTALLSNYTFTNGTFDADDVTMDNVTGDTVEAVWVYINSGTNSTSQLLSYHDGLTLTPSGISVVLQWNNSGIFSL